MKRSLLLILLSHLIIGPYLKVQSQDVQRIIITPPETVVIDKNIKKKLVKYEERCLLGTRDYLHNQIDNYLKSDTIPNYDREYYNGLYSFIQDLSVNNEITFYLANSLQAFTRFHELNQAYIPIHYDGELSMDELEKLANANSADFIIFIDTIKYEDDNSNIKLTSHINLYDNILKQVVYYHTKNEDNERSSKTTCSYKNTEYTLIRNHSNDFSQIYRTLTRYSDQDQRFAKKRKIDYLSEVHDDSSLQSQIREILSANLDSSKTRKFYRGVFNDEKNKFIALLINSKQIELEKFAFPSYFITTYTGTKDNGKWHVKALYGSAYGTKDEPEIVKRSIFFRLEKTKLFIKESGELNPDFWVDEYLKFRLPPGS